RPHPLRPLQGGRDGQDQLLGSMSEAAGHTARVRRVLVLGVLLALAAAGGGWLAFGPSGGAADATARAAAARPAEKASSLPPLPEMRPKVVQPAAGEVAEAA